jgi:hypothetical protein
MIASFIRFRSPLNFLLRQIWFVIVVLKYLNCETFSKDLIAILFHDFICLLMKLVSLRLFLDQPPYSLQLKFLCIVYGVYVILQQILIINQKLMCPIQFLPHLCVMIDELWVFGGFGRKESWSIRSASLTFTWLHWGRPWILKSRWSGVTGYDSFLQPEVH